MRGKRYELEKKVPHRPEKGDQSEHLNPEKTAERLAKEYNVGNATIRRDGAFATALDTLADNSSPEFREKLLTQGRRSRNCMLWHYRRIP